jgi:phosphohistidine phosphatase
MKKLYLIRHAKSSWKDTNLDDFERPLNKRGESNAPFMGKLLKEKKAKPDVILSSPALRAKATAEIIAKKVNHSKKIAYVEKLYEASVGDLLKALAEVGDEHDVAFLFGHNPGLNAFAESCVDFERNVPTCGVLEIEFDCDSWSQANAANARLVAFDYPKK